MATGFSHGTRRSAHRSGARGQKTPEYVTLQSCYTELLTYVQPHAGSIGNVLFQNSYIPQETLAFIRTEGMTEMKKAEKLVDTLLAGVQLNPNVFYGFVDILKNEGPWANDIIQHLETSFASNQTGQNEFQSSVPDSNSSRSNSIHRTVEAVQATEEDLGEEIDDHHTPTHVDRDTKGFYHKRRKPTRNDRDGDTVLAKQTEHNRGENGQVSSRKRNTHNVQENRREQTYDLRDGRSDSDSNHSHNELPQSTCSINHDRDHVTGHYTHPAHPGNKYSRQSSCASGGSTSSNSLNSSHVSMDDHTLRQFGRQEPLNRSSCESSIQNGLTMTVLTESESFSDVGSNSSDDSFHSVSDGVEPEDIVSKPQRDTNTKVELSICCKNLIDLDFFSKSDPVVFVYECSSLRDPNWRKIGRTEIINDNLNPKFATTFVLDYCFEEIQYLKFAVYDIDDRLHIEDLRRHDFIGEAQCTLGDVVAAGQQLCRELSNPKGSNQGQPRGQILLTAEEVQDSKYTVQFEISAHHLDRKDLHGLGKSDPFLEIFKSKESGGYTLVYRSEPIMKELNPRWPEFELSIQKLCNGDWGRGLKFSVWDWNKSGKHKFIGCCYTSLKKICSRRKQPNHKDVKSLILVNEALKKKKKPSGTLNLEMVKAIPTHTFTDYIRGGCQINLIVAIDFTESNRRPDDPSSLHYYGGDQTGDNEYVQAIKSVGSVLGPYDSDQLIPAFGFGAKVPPHDHISHCFPLNFNRHQPEVRGVEGLLEAYHKALRNIHFFGPTNFSQFLGKAKEYARLSKTTQEEQNYTILLVITDGVICDMPQTVDRIVEASLLPLSIVIVGVGGADFTNMEKLDADDTPLKSQIGVPMKRDIVQFVPLRKFRSEDGANFSLSREVLAEIPTQLTSFMKSRKIRPNPVRQARSPALQKSTSRVPSRQQPVSSSPPDPHPPFKSYHSTTSLQHHSSTRSGQS